ncbi:protease pro-enzyme activation domain-containing protein [Occallatibacter savannae]|uniref:protease pro-enzyme activation domain-containing protein n=1 Tax=Occallatibacter savannae TaxID=1002691 RepID=UPI000D6A011E|nr:protease pro-enzyme activation domain-containing protein [Occallatibacter savannae]
MRPVHKLFLGLLALTSLAATSAVAQGPVSKALIRDKVDDNQLTMLRGNTPPAANAQNDLGRVSGNMPMTDLILVLRRSPEMQAAFDALVESQYDPTSPNFHRWLTPEQVGEKFGPALADIATVSAWLSGHGLSVDGVSKDRMTVRFSGTAGQVETAFHTELHNLTVKGEPHFSNMTDPQIPMALEPVVLGPKALHNFVPRPLHRTGGKAVLNQQAGKWQRTAEPAAARAAVPKADAALNGPGSDIVLNCGSGCQVEDLTPYDFATIYNLTPLWTAGTDGTGQTIAIAGRSNVRASDVSSFRSAFGLTGGSFNLIQNGTVNPGFCTGTTGNCTLDDQIENALDVEWAGATAPKATVDLVVTNQTNTNDAIYESANYIINNLPTLKARIINVSYGLCELGMGTSGNTLYNNLWQLAESSGISVFVATGDSGAPACDQGQAAQGPYGAQFGLSVNGIASTVHNTAVGGTDLNWTTASTYWNSTSDSHGATAKGYIPEVPWNDTCTNPLEVAYINQAKGTNDSASTICNKIANHVIASTTNEQGVLDLVNTVGGGGGKSNCTTNDGAQTSSCTGGYSKPSWQTGVSGIPSDGKRDLPDVSFFAGNGFLSSAYLICVSDWVTSAGGSGCVTSSTTNEPTAGEIGGTSAASPAMAGIMALINQKAGSPQGNPNSELYSLAATENYGNCKTESVTNSGACYFNDIDTGTINMPCQAGKPDCTVATPGNTIGVLAGFDASGGYDLASGLGSMNVANVVNHFAAAIGTGASTVTVSASPSAITSIQGTTVTVTVAGGSGTPTGTVTLTSGNYIGSGQALSNGSATFNVPAGALVAGTDTVTANYSGDSTYAASTGTTTVVVTLVNFTLSASAPASISAGGTATSNITVSSTNGYAGTVTLSCALTSSPAGAIEVPTCAPTTGQSTVTLSSGTTSGQGQVTVSTTAPPAAAVKLASNQTGWFKAAGGAALASLLLFLLPGWSKRYRNIFSMMLVVLAASFFAIGCGGGGGSSGGGGGGGVTKTTPTVTVTPASKTIKETDTVVVAIAVAGTSGTPTGSVTLSSGSYNSGAIALDATGKASITIAAGKLAVGTDTLGVTYSGDTNFNSATGSASITVAKAPTTSGTYTFTVTGKGNDAAATTATTTFTVTVN